MVPSPLGDAPIWGASGALGGRDPLWPGPGGLPGVPVCHPEHIPAAGAARPSGSQDLQPEGAERGENGHSPVESDPGRGEGGLRVRLRAGNEALDGWIIDPTFQSRTMSSQVVPQG